MHKTPPIPKNLITPHSPDPPDRLYAVRLRPHLLIMQLRSDATGTRVTATRWPLIVPDLPADRLQTESLKLLDMLGAEMDIFADLSQIRIDHEDAPPVMHLAQPSNDNEYLLIPHAPRLYRIHLNRHGDETGFTHLRGWGAPILPGDDPLGEMREAATFLRSHFGLQHLTDDSDDD